MADATAMTGLMSRLESAAAALVLLDAGDLPGLAALHSDLQAVADAALSACPGIAAAAAHSTELVEHVVLDEVEDPDQAIEVLGKLVSAMQTAVRDGSTVDGFDTAMAETVAEVPEADELGEAKPLEADPNLLAEFVAEAVEHLEAADLNLLALETNPAEADALDAVFRAFHTIKGVAGFLSLTQIGEVAHEAENLLDKARKGELLLQDAAMDVTFEAVDVLKRLVEAVREALGGGLLAIDPAGHKVLARLRAALAAEPGVRIGEVLVRSGMVAAEVVEEEVRAQHDEPDKVPLGERLVRKGEVEAVDVALALRAQRSSGTRPTVPVTAEAVKVDAERLDRILDVIGELVIAESMVSQSPDLTRLGASSVLAQLNHLDKITRELQQLGTSLRMVPVRATFQKMARLVRDVAKKAGKQVELVTFGDETELDKNIVDQIGDPLVHLVRNAVDHGLEATADARTEAGKSPVGRVTLRAYHKGGSIHIEVEDDGRGLNREAILNKAVSRGLVKPGDQLTERDIYNLIFEPGFSTAQQVTDISGRGVGMDVVRRNIENLRGQVDIRTTPGRGSVFTLKLPLTLAIIDGMVVRVGVERYIIPTLSIVTTVRPTEDALSSVIGQGEMLRVQGQLLPVVRLGRLFSVVDAVEDAAQALAVVIEDDGRKLALLTDELLGQQQIVIKSLGESLRGVAGVAGGAVMPDGRVGLIVDVAGIFRLSTGGERATSDSAEAAPVLECQNA